MFVLQRWEQLDELLSLWAWRYKQRSLKKVPITSSPGLSHVLQRLIRCSSPSVQELWGHVRFKEQNTLWIEEPLQRDVSGVFKTLSDANDQGDLCRYWNWTRPILTRKGTWVYPLGPNSTTGLGDRSPEPSAVQPLYHIERSCAFETFARLLQDPVDKSHSLLIRSNQDVIRILIRKLLIHLFDWNQTVLIDLGERPLELLGKLNPQDTGKKRRDEELARDMILRGIRKTLNPSSSERTLIICDTIPTALEAAIVQQLMDSLSGRNPLFLAFDPGEHFSFRWTIHEDLIETIPPVLRRKHTSARMDDVLKKINRILQSLPFAQNMRQIREWLSPGEKMQFERCRQEGLLSEKSGQIVVHFPEGYRQERNCPLEEQKALLRKTLQKKESGLCRLKLMILENDRHGIEACIASADSIRQFHHQPRSLITMLSQCQTIWTENVESALTLTRLTLSMFLLTPSRTFLEYLTKKYPKNREIKTQKEILEYIHCFSIDELIEWVLQDNEPAARSEPCLFASRLREKGFLALALIAEREYPRLGSKHKSADELNAALSDWIFRARCLDNADLMDWIALSCAHLQLRFGAPALARTILRDCLNRPGNRLLPLKESLHFCNILEGHWQKLDHSWPTQLPGGFSPPQIPVWSYLQLLLQHRFADAKQFCRDLFADIGREREDRREYLAGMSLTHLDRLQELLESTAPPVIDKAGLLPPWMEFVLWSVHPFYSGSEQQSPPLPPHLSILYSSERNYFFYEVHYLRFHNADLLTPLVAEQRDLFLDTCAYFSRRGRTLSRRMNELRGSLASRVLSENKASDALLMRTTPVCPSPSEILKAGLNIVSTRFVPEFCFMRFYCPGRPHITEGTQILYRALADRVLDSIPSVPEEQMNGEAIRKLDNGLLTPYLIPWESLRLFRFDIQGADAVLALLMAYRKDPHPCVPLHAPLKRLLSPLLSRLDHCQKQKEEAIEPPLERIIGESPAIQTLKRQIQRISQVSFTVTICGESGTGKELIARAIHELSPRRDKPFITFNCASLPETLLEAELFGYQKGAFTDAREHRAGLIEAADGGTLFLDEIGEMSLQLQAKLLRFLQDHSFRRLGETALRQVDCRILCATHRDLKAKSTEFRFREDLFYRINELSIKSPSLDERIEDLPILLDHFLKKYRFSGLTQMEKHWLALKWMNRPWPGNVRELEARVKELITHYPHQTDVHILPQLKHFGGKLHHCRNQFERICLLNALEKNGWNRNKSAAELGISRTALFKLMRKHRLLSSDLAEE